MNHDVSGANVEQMEIDSIKVGERRRKKLGGIRSLAISIDRHGLIHPILLRDGNELVSGQRRLEACKSLGWRLVPVRHVESLSDEELRAIELDENAERLALADFESSKQRLAQIRQAEAELKAKAADKLRGNDPQKSKRGRPKEAGSTRDVAKAIGISPKEQRNVETHVALAEQYPFMQRDGWVQHQVLEAGSELKKLSEPERGKIASLLDQPAIPPKTAISIISNMAEKPISERREIYQLAQSESRHDRDKALTAAANLPPPNDPALNRIRSAEQELKSAAKVCVTDEFKGSIIEARDLVAKIEKQFTAHIRRSNGIAT